MAPVDKQRCAHVVKSKAFQINERHRFAAMGRELPARGVKGWTLSVTKRTVQRTPEGGAYPWHYFLLDLLTDENYSSKINVLEKEVQQLRSVIDQNNTGSTNIQLPRAVPGDSTAFAAIGFDPASEPMTFVQNSMPGPIYQNYNNQSEGYHSGPPPLVGSVPTSLFAANSNSPSFSGQQLDATYLASNEINTLFKM